MKSKSFIAALLAVFTLGMATSCEDIFNIDSNRVAYTPEISSTADSAYYTLGVLKCMRAVADRYILLGEVRGDMAVIDEERAKTSLRNLANFNFEPENEYLNVRDYYTIINNCNYALAKMDTSIILNNKFVMMDEYAALLGIRAWTYLQLAINYGEVPYYTYPVTSEKDVELAYAEGNKDIKYIAADLTEQLRPYIDYDLPSFAGTAGTYPILRLVLAELYLWGGDYENATKYYEEFFLKNEDAGLSMSDENGTVVKAGYLDFPGAFALWNGTHPDAKNPAKKTVVTPGSDMEVADYVAYIPMITASSDDASSEVAGLFTLGYLQPSPSWKSLSAKQEVFNVLEDGGKSIKSSSKVGDMRRYVYCQEGLFSFTDDAGEEGAESFDWYTKHTSSMVVTQRVFIACLRWAEAMNALAREQFVEGGDSVTNAPARAYAVNSFYLLKDASKVFFPEGSSVRKDFERFYDKLNEDENNDGIKEGEADLLSKYIGVHARGTGDVYYDDSIYVLKPAVIAKRLNRDASMLTFNDTIEYIDELIIDELALESTLEGNRFGDLIRFAKRRGDWGDVDYRHFLANRVANRGVNEETPERDEVLYEKLNGSEDYWYLPFK